jgi:hypothetical protein
LEIAERIAAAKLPDCGQLLVHHRDLVCCGSRQGEFTPAALDPVFRSTELTLLIPEADGSFLMGTRENGLFRFNSGVVSPVTTDVDAFLREKKITRGLRLADGSLALATASSGVVILDQEFRLRGRIDETSELQNNIVLDLFLDREAGLWLCLNSGIARVEAASALSIFDAANGLGRTTVRDVLRFRGTLFACHRPRPLPAHLGRASGCAPGALRTRSGYRDRLLESLRARPRLTRRRGRGCLPAP